MRHLNYNHLLYFWTVARENSIAKAAQVLHLTPQTISGQLKLLEDAIGEPLFHRVGRGLVLSDTGHLVNQYADEIFSLGAELAQRVRDGSSAAGQTLQIGVVDSIPKLIAWRILRVALEGENPVRIVCSENRLEDLLAEMAVHRLDLVLSDRPVPVGLNVKAFNHRLGGSSIAFFARSREATRYRRRFPASLNDAPMLLPMTGSSLRRSLDDWFDAQDVHPRVVAEFADSSMLKTFGQAGAGVFPAPGAIADEIADTFHVALVGEVEALTDSYYAITPERRIKQEIVLRITHAAREALADAMPPE